MDTVVLFATVASNSYPIFISALDPQGRGMQVQQNITTDKGVRFLPVI